MGSDLRRDDGVTSGDMSIVWYQQARAATDPDTERRLLSDLADYNGYKFQGQEAPVAIVSMTASSHGDVPRGMGFLLSRNRVNVAVSRAQWRAVVIRSEELTSFMSSSVEGVLELGAFIGLCRDGAP